MKQLGEKMDTALRVLYNIIGGIKMKLNVFERSVDQQE